MKKNIFILPIAFLALASCSNDTDVIFDQSAAERLEQYKNDYSKILTKDGGLWSMEYFSNSNEPGYVFVVKFNEDGSVDFAANHNWIGGEFKQEKSLWTMIADNGPVLSFNSYNNLFHIFSDPANITGPDAPKNEDNTPPTDIDETGFGHEGDYEFQVMEASDDMVRMMGKKYGYYVYLHRLPADTDVEAYMDEVKGLTSRVSKFFPESYLVDATGETFVVRGIEKQKISVFPQAGDEVMQTVSSCFIFTLDGIRFLSPLEVPRADESAEKMVMTQYFFAEDGTLVAEDGARITGPKPIDAFLYENFDYGWHFGLEDAKGTFASDIQALSDGIVAAYPKKVLEDIYFGWALVESEMTPTLYIKMSGNKAFEYYFEKNANPAEGLKFTYVGCSSTATAVAKNTKALEEFATKFASYTYVFDTDNELKPEVLTMSDKASAGNSCTVTIQ